MNSFISQVCSIGVISPDLPESITQLEDLLKQFVRSTKPPKIEKKADDFGAKIIGKAIKVFDETGWDESIHHLEAVESFLRKIRSPFFPGSVESANRIAALIRLIRLNKPKAVCPFCQGLAQKNSSRCDLCEGWGALPEYKADELTERGMENWNDGPIEEDDEDDDGDDDFAC